MHHIFTPNHVQLLNACYPPSSGLLAAGPNYAPNSHELSRLTYYASNNRGKLTKLGAELEKRLRAECRKACSGNLRMRASLLITLSIFRSLALECKRDIALLSPSLVSSVEITLTSLSNDLEVVVRVASVFTAWTTYTDGHPIGADSTLTANYLSSLRTFASFSRSDMTDTEIRNRTRLVGLSTLTAALNSEALYNDFVQFRAQVAVMLNPIAFILLHSEVSTLDEQAVDVKDRLPILAEFRQRPAYERRAASIHLHVDGERGPSDTQVSDAALRALFSLLSHANSPQLGFIMQSTFDNLDKLAGWSKIEHCCWLAQRIADWAQYQYRYVVPTWLVERLLENQNSTNTTPMHLALTAMITTVLNSPTRMINLSSSDILSNLTTVLVRRSSIDPEDPLIIPLEKCIASLGTHVYYSDQIQDLAGELINRLITAEIQGVLSNGKPGYLRARSAAIRAILAGLSGLIETANKSDAMTQNRPKSPSRSNSPQMTDHSSRDHAHDNRMPRRTRVPPDIWQDTLSLICDREIAVRMEYTTTLVYYISQEMPKYGDSADPDGTKRSRKLAQGPLLQAAKASAFLHPGDVINRLLNALHAYYYMLLTCSDLGLTSATTPDTSPAAAGDISLSHSVMQEEDLNDSPALDRRASISPSQITGRPSFSLSQGPRDKKASLVYKYLKRAPSCLSTSPAASFKDIQDALKVLQTVQEQVPTRGLLAGVPMLLALQRTLKSPEGNPTLLKWMFALDELLARVWLSIGTVWNAHEVVQLAEQALGSMTVSFIAAQPSLSEDAFLTLQDFSWNQGIPWSPLNGEAVVNALVSNEGVLSTFGVDKESLSRRLSAPWTPEAALNDFDRLTGFEATVRGDGVSPLLRISPALMQMNNMSLQSLARSTRGLGVTDLREALEGRSSMSNPALARPPSISTYDHGSSLVSGENGVRPQSRSRSRSKKRATPSAAGEVRDVLSKLGLGKQNGNLLKASFSALQKSDHLFTWFLWSYSWSCNRVHVRSNHHYSSVRTESLGRGDIDDVKSQQRSSKPTHLYELNSVYHLSSLVDDSSGGPSTSDHSRRDIDQWFSHNSSAHKLHADDYENEAADISESSVLDVYLLGQMAGEDTNELIQRLKSNSNHDTVIPAILSLLSSQDLNEGISEQMAELVGFENLDLVMELLDKRETSKQIIRHYLSSNQNGVSLGEAQNGPPAFSTKPDINYADLSAEAAKKRMERAFEENANKPLFSGTAYETAEELPHVYSSTSLSQNSMLSSTGHKYLLPLGTERMSYEEYDEVVVPPARPVPPKSTERLVPISELDSLAKGCFPGYSSLNRIQSIVYPTAYGSNENMLICAPTGAGKTDVAMLTILRVIDQHHSKLRTGSGIPSTIDRNAFKIIYVAPMKALASEIVRKLGKRLRWLSIEVRELTGDMQMTKAEIAATQIIVTTPEKWDVVTRKPTGEGELASSLKLLIIDEVHLLNDERGAVIETIVARTLRQVESSQSIIRIVGLSATLPNFIDVAEFLSVSKYKGLFYFDSSFRPVPLEQHFLGIKGKPGSALARRNLDYVTYEKVSELVAQGHQVMVFVHARKETVKAAMDLKEASLAKGSVDDFSCQDHPQWALFRRDISQSRNKEMKLLFDHGFGIHHAGMLRSDRNLMERLFEARAIKVLCCTATLAWGVNLPAHAVVIKGTQVYDSSKGSFQDLSVLDVLQVFGRAGRPGLETSGEGYICTTDDKLTHYLEAVTSQNPIESQFRKGIIDALNAEISLGTVANLRDAVQWLGYTYLHVRMRKNPFIYGIAREDVADDPQLVGKRRELIGLAVNQLAEAKMVVRDHRTEGYTSTELGRIAAKYYLRYTSVEIFNKEFRPRMSEADVLAMLSMSTEASLSIKSNCEIRRLKNWNNYWSELLRKGDIDTSEGKEDAPVITTSQEKVNILLQAYISQEILDDFALVSDMAYVAQNAGRIIRALLEIAFSRKWANVTMVLIGLSKAIEKRLWPYEHPLRQFELKAETLFKLQEWADEWSVHELLKLDAPSLGELIHLNEPQGQAVLKAAKQFPSLQIDYRLRPLGHDVLRISLQLTPCFTWNPRLHGTSEPFWVWIEEYEGLTILQLAHIIVRPSTEKAKLDFIINIPAETRPHFLTIRVVCDRWIGAEEEMQVPLDTLVMPAPPQSHTPLLSLPLLSTSILKQQILQASLSQTISTFDAIQTQAYWTLTQADYHALLCAPSGNGKSTLARILALVKTEQKADFWTMIITPHYGSAHEMYADLQQICSVANIPLELASSTRALARPRSKMIRIVTTHTLLTSLAALDPLRVVSGLDLIICDDLEQLDSTYEWAICLLRHATQFSPTRYVGFSESLNDPTDLADWLNIHPTSLISFRPRDRDQVLNFSIQSFSIPHSASLFKAMAKPTHAAISTAPPGENALVIVSSRGLCRPTALNLLTQCILEMESTRGYLPENVSDEYVEDACARLEDASLADFVNKGIGFFHSGIRKRDRLAILSLFAEGTLRALIVPHDSILSLPVRAAVVVVMGTQYVSTGDTASSAGDRQILDYSLSKIVCMQSRAVRHSGPGHFFLFCQAEARDTLTRFLNDGLPLESELSESSVVVDWMQGQKVDWREKKQDLIDILSFSFLARRLVTNPSYYDSSSQDRNESLSRFVDRLVEQASQTTGE
ncbi:hypothetical protein NP233_g2488 [Leucocoprinus birnbaumii]|uniref:Sec63-domain-containing protein n=1 Tax=Leucocoprinus birnbaumii TaxID=56174 RepID=A0AAD5YX93_9AGAR|nr:hypothetical protein NP233_g2488 [Leucocoprinus birnbaumii]